MGKPLLPASYQQKMETHIVEPPERIFKIIFFLCRIGDIESSIFGCFLVLTKFVGGGDDGDVTYRHQIGWTKISASCIICDC